MCKKSERGKIRKTNRYKKQKKGRKGRETEGEGEKETKEEREREKGRGVKYNIHNPVSSPLTSKKKENMPHH